MAFPLSAASPLGPGGRVCRWAHLPRRGLPLSGPRCRAGTEVGAVRPVSPCPTPAPQLRSFAPGRLLAVGWGGGAQARRGRRRRGQRQDLSSHPTQGSLGALAKSHWASWEPLRAPRCGPAPPQAPPPRHPSCTASSHKCMTSRLAGWHPGDYPRSPGWWVPQSLGVAQPPPQAMRSAPRSGILKLAAGPGLCSLAAPVMSRRVSCTVTLYQLPPASLGLFSPPTLAAGTLSAISRYSITALCLEYTCFPIIPQTKPNRFALLLPFIHMKRGLGFPSGSVVKNSPAMQETRIQSLCQEDP